MEPVKVLLEGLWAFDEMVDFSQITVGEFEERGLRKFEVGALFLPGLLGRYGGIFTFVIFQV